VRSLVSNSIYAKNDRNGPPSANQAYLVYIKLEQRNRLRNLNYVIFPSWLHSSKVGQHGVSSPDSFCRCAFGV